MKLSYERKKAYYGYFFISVWLIGFIVLFLIPLITSFRYSISTVKIEQGYVALKNIGFKNYKELFTTNAEFLPAFTGTLSSVLIKTPLVLIFSLFVAIILNQKFKGRLLARAIFFLPVVISGGVAMKIINGDYFMGLIMSGDRSSMMFESSSLQEMFANSGIPQTAITYIQNMVDSIFQLSWVSGIQILIFLAGLQSISPTLYEVASVEGSNAWVTFWKITLPMIAPMLLVNIFYTFVDNMINYSNDMFQLIDLRTQNLDFAVSSAMAFINFAVVLLIVAVVYAVGNRFVHYTVE